MDATFNKNALTAAVATSMMLCSAAAWSYSSPSVACGADATTCQVVTASSGNLTAQAVFQYDSANQDLYVTLINASTFDITQPADVLTALLFNLNYTNGTTVQLSPLTALMSNAADTGVTFDAQTIDSRLQTKTCEGAVEGGSCTTSEVVGGEWRHSTGFSSHQQFGSFTNAIHSAGLDLTGTPNFEGPNLEDPTQVDGGQYGIVGCGDNPNTDIQGGAYNPVTQCAVQFKLDILNASGNTLNLTQAGLVAGFQYGTTPGSNPFLPPSTVSTPATLALLGVGVLAMGWNARRRRT